MYKKSCTKLLFCLSTYCFFRRSRCRQKRRKRLPTLKAMQERNLCLQGRMGGFSEWSSVSFNVTITNFFGTIERFGITLTSLQQTSHWDWKLLKLGQKVKSNSTGRALKTTFLWTVSGPPSFLRAAHGEQKSWIALVPRSPLTCALCYLSTVTQKKKKKKNNKRLLAVKLLCGYNEKY